MVTHDEFAALNPFWWLHSTSPAVFDVFDLIRYKGQPHFHQFFHHYLLRGSLKFFFIGYQLLHWREGTFDNRFNLNSFSIGNYQSIIWLIVRSISRAINFWMDWWISKSINLQINKCINSLINQLINLSFYYWMNYHSGYKGNKLIKMQF